MARKVMQRNYDSEGKLINKECSCCHKMKPVSEFSANKRAKDGLQCKCKECDSKRRSKKRRKILIKNYDNEGNLISKECTRCHKMKPVSEFYECERNKDGVRSQCKECVKKYMQDNAENIKEYRKEYSKQYYKDNAEVIKDKRKQYYQNNAEKIKKYNREYGKQYSQENKEKKKEYGKQYRQDNAEHYKKYRQDNKEKKKRIR